jgi:glycine oxidase
MTACDVAIVGGGVIGLSVAYELAREGISATVLDTGPLGRAASWAGAGMIAPEADRPPSTPMIALRDLSVRLHPEWARALKEETGIDNGYRKSGGLDVAFTHEEDTDLRGLAGRWREEGVAFERLEPRDFGRVETALSPQLRIVYFLPDRAQLRNPWHLRALIQACSQRGVSLHPYCGVVGFKTDRERVTAVETVDGPVDCQWVVAAAGPWSEGILDRLGLRVPTPPVKGQIALLHTVRPMIARIIEHGSNYLVPRDDGRILVGSTEEYAGFDTSTTNEAIERLIAEAKRLCPCLAEARVEQTWAGLRPGSIDTRPYLGVAPGFENLVVATGHKRAGLQLSTGTAVLVADLILGRKPRIDLTPFRVARQPDGEADAFRS